VAKKRKSGIKYFYKECNVFLLETQMTGIYNI